MLLVGGYALQKDQLPYSMHSLNFLESTTLLAAAYALLGGTLFYQSEFGELGMNILGICVILIVFVTGLMVIFMLLYHFRFAYAAYRNKAKKIVNNVKKSIDQLAKSVDNIAKHVEHGIARSIESINISTDHKKHNEGALILKDDLESSLNGEYRPKTAGSTPSTLKIGFDDMIDNVDPRTPAKLQQN